MLEWIPVAILLIIIASVVIWGDKKKVRWYSVVNIVIILGIIGGAGWVFNKMREFSPSDGGFWFYLVIGGLFILLLWRFWEIQAEYQKLKEQDEQKKRLEEESREREYRRERQD